MLKDFKAFIAKGNVIDLAVAVIIGGAFSTIVKSLTDEIIMPVVGAIFGGADFSRYFILLDTPEGYDGPMDDYAALQEAGAAMIGYGSFVTAVINFLILAFIIFLLVRYAKKVIAEFEEKPEEVITPPGPTEIDLLKEIRDELRNSRSGGTAAGAGKDPAGG
ncbi:large conductance mechanosensitive channel protein MscL [Qipengyuania sp. NPDC077563]|uniref:large conductance mechanosensitive channel protein MscL n=1 Tax=Qipengyuania sp. NPDC077563 TaxID=3364497 RepID=UPI00384F6E50